MGLVLRCPWWLAARQRGSSPAWWVEGLCLWCGISSGARVRGLQARSFSTWCCQRLRGEGAARQARSPLRVVRVDRAAVAQLCGGGRKGAAIVVQAVAEPESDSECCLHGSFLAGLLECLRRPSCGYPVFSKTVVVWGCGWLRKETDTVLQWGAALVVGVLSTLWCSYTGSVLLPRLSHWVVVA